jgi:hypothetical protein
MNNDGLGNILPLKLVETPFIEIKDGDIFVVEGKDNQLFKAIGNVKFTEGVDEYILRAETVELVQRELSEQTGIKLSIDGFEEVTFAVAKGSMGHVPKYRVIVDPLKVDF